MKKIPITLENKEYQIEVVLVESYSSGYFKVEWVNKKLQKILASPIYIEYRCGNGIVLPPARNLKELTFFTSIAQGIFLDYFDNKLIVKNFFN